MDLVSCNVCGRPNAADVSICPGCGWPPNSEAVGRRQARSGAEDSPAPEPASAAAPLVCPAPGCGEPLDPDEVVCRFCGEPVVAERPGELVFPWGPHRLAPEESIELGRACPPFAEELAAYPNVSRRHARVGTLDGELVVTDLGSANGTFVDGVRIPPLVPTGVAVGTILRLTSTRPEIEIR